MQIGKEKEGAEYTSAVYEGEGGITARCLYNNPTPEDALLLVPVNPVVVLQNRIITGFSPVCQIMELKQPGPLHSPVPPIPWSDASQI